MHENAVSAGEFVLVQTPRHPQADEQSRAVSHCRHRFLLGGEIHDGGQIRGGDGHDRGLGAEDPGIGVRRHPEGVLLHEGDGGAGPHVQPGGQGVGEPGEPSGNGECPAAEAVGGHGADRRCRDGASVLEVEAVECGVYAALGELGEADSPGPVFGCHPVEVQPVERVECAAPPRTRCETKETGQLPE